MTVLWNDPVITWDSPLVTWDGFLVSDIRPGLIQVYLEAQGAIEASLRSQGDLVLSVSGRRG